MVNLGKLAISQRLVVAWHGAGGIALQFNIENGRDGGLGRAKGTNNDASFERQPGASVLNRKVFLALDKLGIMVSLCFSISKSSAL